MKLYANQLNPSLCGPLEAIIVSAYDEPLLGPAVDKVCQILFPDAPTGTFVRMPAALLKTDPDKVRLQMNSQVLFGTPPLFIFEGVTEGLLKPLQVLLEKGVRQKPLILTSGYFKSSSKLRQYFEVQKNVGLLAVYAPKPQDLVPEVQALCKEYGRTAEPQLVTHLCELYHTHPGLLGAELAPFLLTEPEWHHFTLSDFLAYRQVLEGDEEAMLRAFFAKQPFPPSPAAARPPVMGFLRYLNYHALEFLRYQTDPQRGRALSLVNKAFYDQHQKAWPQEALLNLLSQLHTWEIQAKRNGQSLVLEDLWQASSIAESL